MGLSDADVKKQVSAVYYLKIYCCWFNNLSEVVFGQSYLCVFPFDLSETF